MTAIAFVSTTQLAKVERVIKVVLHAKGFIIPFPVTDDLGDQEIKVTCHWQAGHGTTLSLQRVSFKILGRHFSIQEHLEGPSDNFPHDFEVDQDIAESTNKVTAEITRLVAEHDRANVEEQDAIIFGDWCFVTMQTERQTTSRVSANKMSSRVLAQPALPTRLMPIGLDTIEVTNKTAEELLVVVHVEKMYKFMRQY